MEGMSLKCPEEGLLDFHVPINVQILRLMPWLEMKRPTVTDER